MLVLGYEVPGFDKLTLRERKLLYYLQEASLSARDILYDQRFAENLAVRRTLEAVLETYTGNRDTEAFRGLVRYAKRVFFASGIHHPVSGTRMLPEALTAAQLAMLIQHSDGKRLPLRPGQSVGEWIAHVTPLLFGDPDVAHAGTPETTPDPLRDAPTHVYVGVTTAEAVDYYAQPKPGQPPRHPLNSRLVRRGGRLEEEVYRIGGLYGEALSQVVRWLEAAQEVASGETQRAALASLAEYYRTGDPATFGRYSEAWLRDEDSVVDLVHGFISTEGDPLGIKGYFNALVSLRDAPGTAQLAKLVENAPYFEARSPVDPAFRREHFDSLTARASEAVISAGQTAPMLPVGTHFPFDPEERETVGTRGSTLTNVLQARSQPGLLSGVLSEFVLGERERRRARTHGTQAHVLMASIHEVLGHAAGRLDESRDRIGSLGAYRATLEEARADLYALYFLFDPKLIALGLMPNFEVARAAYDAYARRALLLCLQTLDDARPLEDPQVSAARLVMHWARSRDPLKAPSVQRVLHGGKTYFEITDYLRLRAHFGALLAEVQRITSQSDAAAARSLIEKHAVPVDDTLRKQVRARQAALGLPTVLGFLQPRLVAERGGDEILDVRLDYPRDFLSQQLQDSARYSFLPTDTRRRD